MSWRSCPKDTHLPENRQRARFETQHGYCNSWILKDLQNTSPQLCLWKHGFCFCFASQFRLFRWRSHHCYDPSCRCHWTNHVPAGIVPCLIDRIVCLLGCPWSMTILPGRDVIRQLHTDLVEFLGVVQCLVAGRSELPTNHSVEPQGLIIPQAFWVNVPGRCDSCQHQVRLHCEYVLHALHFCCPASRHHAKVELLLLRQEPGATSKQNYFQVFLVQV